MNEAVIPSPTRGARPHRVPGRELIVTFIGVVLAGLTITAILVGQFVGPEPDRPWIEAAAMLLTVSVFLACATILLSRLPGHPVSWLMALPILFMVLDLLAAVTGQRDDTSKGLWLVWAAEASWAVTFPTLIIFLPLVFPTGRPPSPRWRWVIPVGLVAVVGLTFGNAVSADLLDGVDNPAAIGGPVGPIAITIGGALFLVSGLASLASAIVRRRAATGAERQQLRWFVRGAAVVPVTVLLAGALDSSSYGYLSVAVFGVGMSVLPLAVTAAILRYRLYDIDRIVSRVVTYAFVTLLLLVMYAGIVLGATAVLSVRSDPPDAVVAVATLTVAAAFRPVRTRIQTSVDRRFNRTRHDNQRVLSHFAEQVRDEVAADELTRQLKLAVAETLSPRHVSVCPIPRPSPRALDH